MMKRCVIITALLDCELSEIYKKQAGDYIICADGGMDIAKKNSITPDISIGDLDSTENLKADSSFIKFPKEKDDTDTMLCLRHGLEQGYKEFVIIGGIGGRLDHTIANLQTLAFAKKMGAKASLHSKNAYCKLITDGESAEIKKQDDFYLSLFSYSEKCEGVSVSGTKYELKDGSLENSFPLGVSNEFASNTATISIKKGTLLIVLSRK